MSDRSVQFFFLWGYLALLCLGVGCGDKTTPPPAEAKVKFRNQMWTVELAMSDRQRYQGLSGRTSLPTDRGMLFVYPQEQKLSFCMRGCEIPIDIAFLDRHWRVVNLYEMTVESDRAGRVTYESHVPAMYAFELPGGELKRLGVRVGDTFEPIGVPPASDAEPGQ